MERVETCEKYLGNLICMGGLTYFLVKDGEVAWDGRSLFLWHLASLQFVKGMENIWLCMEPNWLCKLGGKDKIF